MKPIVLFIVPLVSRRYAKDWAKVCGLLEATLRSLANQSNANYKCLIVSDEMPAVHASPKIQFVQADFLLEDPKRYGARCVDKQKKVYLALLAAREIDPEFVMVLDGDDLLHRDLVAFVASNLKYDGFVLGRGYFLTEGDRKARLGFRMELACASTSVFRFNRGIFPSQTLADDSKAYLKFPLSATPHVREPRAAFASWEYKIIDVPFRSMVYRVHDAAMSSARLSEKGRFRVMLDFCVKLVKLLFLSRVMGIQFRNCFGMN